MGIVEFKVRSWSLPDVRSTLKSAHRRLSRHVRFVPILLQKSKIEELRKPRESRVFDGFTAARPCRTDTAARGRFCVK